MMDILFRGKTLSGEWVGGYLIGSNVIVGDIVKFTKEYFNCEYWYKVDPATVGLYTGLKDKNGVGICEGDIVTGKDKLRGLPIIGVIAFENGSFVIKDDTVTHYRWLDYTLEVAGNIHDRPDLLGICRKRHGTSITK